jgi:hypothetical protein
MLFLQGHGVSPTYAVKIYRHYKERSIEVVEQNPYQLATDIWGIGFKSADKIAQNIGIAPDDPKRLEAGLVYVLNEQMDGGGHCFLPEDDLVKAACEILQAEHAPVERALGELVASERLVAETVELMGTADTAIYTPAIHTTEKAVAERINTLLLVTLAQPPQAGRTRRRHRGRAQPGDAFRRTAPGRAPRPIRAADDPDRRPGLRENVHHARDRGCLRGAAKAHPARVPDRPGGQAARGDDRPRSQDDPPVAGVRPRKTRLQARAGRAARIGRSHY